MLRAFLAAGAALAALALAPAASAAYATCPSGTVVVDVYQSVLNDRELGVLGHVWAGSDYTRRIVVVRTSGQYCAWSTFQGKFHTFAGVSPNATGTVREGIGGSQSGRWASVLFSGRFRPTAPTSGFIGTVDFGCDQTGLCTGPTDWLTMYFRDTSGYGLASWTKGYSTTENGTYVDRNDPTFVGTYGDITG